MSRACKDCGSSKKKLGHPGPRCLGCHRVFKLEAKRRQLDRYYRKTYSMSLEEYEELYDFQGGRCWVCQWATGASKRLCVDHSHDCCPTTPTCGRCTRGLICSQDNQLLGRARDNPEFFRRAVGYLEDPPYRQLQDHKRNKR